MNVTAHHCHIDTDLDSESRHAAMSAYPCMNHFGFCLSMLCGEFYLARKDGGMFIVAIPSERWLQDLKDDGFEIVQSLTRNAVPKDTVQNNHEALVSLAAELESFFRIECDERGRAQLLRILGEV